MINFPIAWADKIDSYYRKFGFNMNQDVPGCVQAWQSFYAYIVDFVDKNVGSSYRNSNLECEYDDIANLTNALSQMDDFLKVSYYDIIKDGGPSVMNNWALAKKGADTYAVRHMDPEWAEMYTRYNKVDIEL